MRRVLFVLPALFFFSLMGQRGNASSDFPWQKIDEGFEFKAVQVEGEPYDSLMRIKILRISLEHFQVRVLDSRAFGEIKLEIKELAKKTHALAAINGGFFMPGFQPLGLLIMDGKEVNPLRNADWGVFLVENHSAQIIHTREYRDGRNIFQALQVGPRLVVRGRELQMKKQKARRAAVGITAKNQIILVHTNDTEVYAQDLARIFCLPESQGGLECVDALSLDGGPSAQMYVEYKSLKIDIPGGWGVPNGIGVFKRKP
jgi:uncharacterized protein YigE (DUF2233 family)